MRDVLKTLVRVLTFRVTAEELGSLDRRHLRFGLAATWVVGMGRYWDDPRAVWGQKLGLGSVVYVFVLSALLWLVVTPFNPPRWRYRDVLTFVTLTSPPAILYAIPVERWTDIETAISLNIAFLALVALWRVALWVFYLRRYAQAGVFATIVISLLPLTAIVATLTALNLEHAVFDIMGGLRERTPHDGAYMTIVMLTFLSVWLIIPLLISYAVLVYRSRS